MDETTRTRVMQSIRKRDTAPELRVRKALHALGWRYRLQARDLAGTPDIVFRRQRIAVQVQGCFWHQHPGCGLARRPKGNLDYWEPKLARNVERDAATRATLEAIGWRVVIVWECETRDPARLAAAVGMLAAMLRGC